MRSEKRSLKAVIQLGTASKETKGAWGMFSDEVLTHNMPGLAND